MAYYPTPNTTSAAGFAHLQSVYYKRKGLDQLKTVFRFGDACEDDMIPLQNGRSIQWFRYALPTANTTPSVEGTVPTSGTFRSNTVGGDLSQYSSYISLSTMATRTAIDPIVEGAADYLGYQAGLTVDRLSRDVFDNESASTNQTLLNGTTPTIADFRASAAYLHGANVMPKEDGNFYAIVHPYNVFDLVNDPAANGYSDIFKHSDPNGTAIVNFNKGMRGTLDTLAGVRIVPTTNVYSSGGTYRAYVIGKGAMGKAALEGTKPTYVSDPQTERFAIKVKRFNGEISVPDPTGEIGAIASYYFTYLCVPLDGPAGIGGTYRWKSLDCATTLA